ncbi:hypothetical protein JCM21900_006991 [Sporobolomyces salmonicolor]
MSDSAPSDSPFAFSAPLSAQAPPSGPFHAILSAHLPDSTLVPVLSRLASTLYTHRVAKEVHRELGQLQGELRDEYAVRAKTVKADWMARVVPQDLPGEEAPSAPPPADGAAAEPERPTLLHPTILSDADETAAMSARVDQTVEDDMSLKLNQARERVKSRVESRETMEIELFLGQAILDGHGASAGDEQGAARYVQDRLEDALLDVDIDPVAVLQASGA